MEMKPGARPHCGMKRRLRAGGQLPHAPGAGDVFGQVEVVHFLGNGGLGNRCREMKRRGAQHRELPGKGRAQGGRLGDVERLHLNPVARRDAGQRGGRCIDHRDRVITGRVQQGGNGRADVAGADKHDFFHRKLLVETSKA